MGLQRNIQVGGKGRWVVGISQEWKELSIITNTPVAKNLKIERWEKEEKRKKKIGRAEKQRSTTNDEVREKT